MASTKPNYVKAALMMPANLFALAAGGAASLALGEWLPLAATAAGSVVYLVSLSVMPSFRRAVRANLEAQTGSEVAGPEELKRLLADLAPSQRAHYLSLVELKGRILERYQALPGGRVFVASSQRRLEVLLTSFVRLVSTLNAYQRYLGAGDRKLVEEELAQLVQELATEQRPRLQEVKQRRLELLKRRQQRFAQAQEQRELASHQLASIEDALHLTFEQSISISSPEVVGLQLEALGAEVSATEDTVREMEQFMRITEDFGPAPDAVPPRERVR